MINIDRYMKHRMALWALLICSYVISILSNYVDFYPPIGFKHQFLTALVCAWLLLCTAVATWHTKWIVLLLPQLPLMGEAIGLLALQVGCAKELAYCFHGSPPQFR